MENFTNTEYATTNMLFQNACEKAGIPTTSRQASKFQRGKGLAYKVATLQLKVELNENNQFIKIIN